MTPIIIGVVVAVVAVIATLAIVALAAYIYINRKATVPLPTCNVCVPASELCAYISISDAMMLDAAYWTLERQISGVDKPDGKKCRSIQTSISGCDNERDGKKPGIQVSETKTTETPLGVPTSMIEAWYSLSLAGPQHGDKYLRRTFEHVKSVGKDKCGYLWLLNGDAHDQEKACIELGKTLWPDTPEPDVKQPETAVVEGSNESKKGESK